MGKGWKKNQKPAQHPPWRGGGGQQQWSIWPGAWHSPRRSTWRQDWPEQDGRQFPAYDAAWKQAPGIVTAKTDPAPVSSGGSLVSNMQHVVNQARRIETKLAKLRTEAIQRGQSWEKYLEDARQAVAKERSRHENNQRRITKEIEELEMLQASVYEQVTHVALECKHENVPKLAAEVVGDGRPGGPQAMDVELGLASPGEGGDEPLSDFDLASELQRIVNLAQQKGARAAAPRTPPRRPSGSPSFTPPPTTRASPDGSVCRGDPYPTISMLWGCYFNAPWAGRQLGAQGEKPVSPLAADLRAKRPPDATDSGRDGKGTGGPRLVDDDNEAPAHVLALDPASFTQVLVHFGSGIRGLGQVSSPFAGPLDWRLSGKPQPWHKHEAFPCGGGRGAGNCPCPQYRTLLLLWLCGFSALPVSVAAPFPGRYYVGPVAFLGFLPHIGHAVQLPAVVPHRPSLPPHQVPVAELVHYMGPCVRNVDVTASPAPTSSRLPWLVEIPPRPPPLFERAAGGWLGVLLLTPHFRPVRVAVRCQENHGLQHVLDVLQDEAPGGGIRAGQLCVPVRPQPFSGFGTFVRFPSLVHQQPQGRIVATVLDLRSLGGYMFACLLPQRMPIEELVDFVSHMVSFSDESLIMMVGSQQHPHDMQSPVLFQHGDLVVFSRGQRPPPNFASAHQLFSHGAVWQDAELLPTLGADEGLLVQHQGERIFLPPHHHIGQTSVGALACTWDYPSGAMTTAAFPTPNLEFRGNFCSHLLRVVGIPAVNPDTPANVRRKTRPPSPAGALYIDLPDADDEPFDCMAVAIVHDRRSLTAGNSKPADRAAWELPLPALRPNTEPVSHSAAARAELEDIRDFVEADGRPWPYVPADDQFAIRGIAARLEAEEEGLQMEVGTDITFCLLTPDYSAEHVVLSLTAPLEVADALLAVQESRDPIRARLFPWIIPIDPQPSQGYGILLALPGWATNDVVACMDTSAIDDRLFVVGVPAVASRETLLDIAGLPQHDRFDVYVGTSHVPLQAGEEVDMQCGLCVFFIHRHDLPGPYFRLHATLLSSHVWEDAPLIPSGPDIDYLCAVWDMGHKRVRSDNQHPFLDGGAVALQLGMSPGSATVTLATRAARDVSLAGYQCWNVCAVAAAEAGAQPSLLAALDCRAMLQGWTLLASPDGRIDKAELEEDLSTFAPPGWEIHIEGLQVQDGLYLFEAGQIGFASFVPIREDDALSVSQVAQSDPELDSEADGDESSDASCDSSSEPSPPRIRSRSPYRSPRSDGERRGRGRGMPFLILGQEYAPELVCIPFFPELGVGEVLQQVQQRRDPDAVQRFSRLVPVHPQPSGAFALVIAQPEWSTDVFVAFDLSRLTGAIYCWLSSPCLTRSSILAITGVADTGDVEVYVPGHDLPLGPTEVCRLSSGACVSVVPARCPFFVVAALEDMICSAEGWDTEAALPCVPGDFLHLLTDGGPCSTAIDCQPAGPLREAVLGALHLPSQSTVLQLADPPLDDFSDSGHLGWNVMAVTQDHVPAIRHGPGCVYFLDLRPILCGVTWAFSDNGLVSVALICRQCARPEVGRSRVIVSGGRQPSPTVDGCVAVRSGDVLVVQFADAPALPRPLHNAHGPALTDGSSRPTGPAYSDSAANGPSTPHRAAGLTAADSASRTGATEPPSMMCLSQHTREAFAVFGCRLLLVVSLGVWTAAAAVFLPGACGVLLARPLARGAGPLLVIAALACMQAATPVAAMQVCMTNLHPVGDRPHLCAPAFGPSLGPPRTLPTPCRAPPRVPAVGEVSSALGRLCTLLEESVEARGDETFLDASTLLDVLLEHSVAADSSPPPPARDIFGCPATGAPTLCLSDLLGYGPEVTTPSAGGSETFDMDGRQCLLPGDPTKVNSVLRRTSVAQLRPPPVQMTRLRSFSAWIDAGSVG
ncbi:unnamed protein product [Symbiodinium microadriaticum]|nr:unnamed protein product [Symbiodinium microadriaticum]CAE7939674.1 unnamed protein product [Symbiodinium sp. KB8]